MPNFFALDKKVIKMLKLIYGLKNLNKSTAKL